MKIRHRMFADPKHHQLQGSSMQRARLRIIETKTSNRVVWRRASIAVDWSCSPQVSSTFFYRKVNETLKTFAFYNLTLNHTFAKCRLKPSTCSHHINKNAAKLRDLLVKLHLSAGQKKAKMYPLQFIVDPPSRKIKINQNK